MAEESIVTKHQSHEKDTGSTKVQVALLSEKILELTGHLKTHKKDFDSRSGLLKMVGRRRRLLKYLASSEADVYASFIKELGLRK